MILPNNTQLTLSDTTAYAAQAVLFVDEGCPYLEGHFDKRAVLPGVVQIGWIIALAEQAFNLRFSFHALKMMKCTQLVLPPIELDMKLEYHQDKGYIKFQSHTATGKCASGLILVEVMTQPEQEAR